MLLKTTVVVRVLYSAAKKKILVFLDLIPFVGHYGKSFSFLVQGGQGVREVENCFEVC